MKRHEQICLTTIVLTPVVGMIFLAVLIGSLPAQQPPAPAKAPQQAVKAPKARRPRGATPTPRHKIFSAKKYSAKAAPSSFAPPGLASAQLSYWGNDVVGDCVSAEEMAKLVTYSLMCGLPEVFIPSATATQWARQNGYLNGADLMSVMETMASSGITSGGVTYKDGPASSVDYTSYATTCAAISEGQVKIGVAADQLEDVVGTTNGWIATGFGQDGDEDHCIGLVGYGTMTQCCQALNVTPPSNAANFAQCYIVFTWSTFGVMDHASMVAITGEAWVRNPSTVGESPTPTPAPTGLTYTLTGTVPPGAKIDASGNFTWPNPTVGLTTVTFTVAANSTPATGTFNIVVTAAPTSTVVINPIPVQAVTAGQPFSLNLGNYVTTTTAGGHK